MPRAGSTTSLRVNASNKTCGISLQVYVTWQGGETREIIFKRQCADRRYVKTMSDRSGANAKDKSRKKEGQLKKPRQ